MVTPLTFVVPSRTNTTMTFTLMLPSCMPLLFLLIRREKDSPSFGSVEKDSSIASSAPLSTESDSIKIYDNKYVRVKELKDKQQQYLSTKYACWMTLPFLEMRLRIGRLIMTLSILLSGGDFEMAAGSSSLLRTTSMWCPTTRHRMVCFLSTTKCSRGGRS